MKRGKVEIEAPAPKEFASSGLVKVPSFVDAVASTAGPAGAAAASSETATASSPLAFLLPSVEAATSSTFLLREGSSSLAVEGTLATVGWPIFFTPVLHVKTNQ